MWMDVRGMAALGVAVSVGCGTGPEPSPEPPPERPSIGVTPDLPWVPPSFSPFGRELPTGDTSPAVPLERSVVIVQDWSASMMVGAPPRPIDRSRAAVRAFLDEMVEQDQPGDKFGITGYARYGVSSDGTPVLDRTGTPFAPLLPLDTELETIQQRVAAICGSDLPCPLDEATGSTPDMSGPDQSVIGSCTNPSIGMVQALEMLRHVKGEHTYKAMVVFSDGVFNCTTESLAEPWDAEFAASAAANEAYDLHDIHVYSVFCPPDRSISEESMQYLVRGQGTYHRCETVANLEAVFGEVVELLPTMGRP